ncbi:hypothetical protein [Streptomyces sp. NPDC052012]|uniref:hypothetical protein n=1 Tax=Streptomyces sp. NPDC052012 TaxID=3155051 RepID=UPI00344E9884
MDQRFTAIDDLLNRGPRPPQLPHPDERRHLREAWGASIEEVANALGKEPETMAAWEAGRITADLADTYAYLRLLNGFRERMPVAYEPDRGPRRSPSPPAIPATRPPSEPVPEATAPAGIKAAGPGDLWTQEARDYLRERFLAGDDPAELAQKLGRSEKALRWQLWDLKLTPFPADDVPAPSKLPAPKAYTVEEKRKVHPNAYRRWTSEDDEHLADRCAEGASLAELSTEFGRNLGAIASRLIKIGAAGPALEEAEENGG